MTPDEGFIENKRGMGVSFDVTMHSSNSSTEEKQVVKRR